MAPRTTSTEASNTISCPAPNRGATSMVPNVPPMALARPPPPADVVSQGSHELTESTAAHSATNQPGAINRPDATSQPGRAILRP